MKENSTSSSTDQNAQAKQEPQSSVTSPSDPSKSPSEPNVDSSELPSDGNQVVDGLTDDTGGISVS